VHITGGQLVNLDHVVTLRKLGYDARLLIVRQPEEGGRFVPSFPDGSEAPWQLGTAGLAADDVVVVGEMFGAGALALNDSPCRKVLHNQGPYYSFAAFRDLAAVREWGAEAMIFPSAFAALMVRRMGWDRGLHVVRPALDPAFAAAADGERELRICAIPNRRPQEYRLIRGIFWSLHPRLAGVPWIEMRGLPRPEVARLMAGSEIYLALGQLEGLGLPPLEAMAAGALVVGFDGGGGQEYASPENGDWFEEGRHFEIADMLARRIREIRAGERFEARRAAAARTAAEFSREAFERQLATTWAGLVGPP
jgi:hypothetical protein